MLKCDIRVWSKDYKNENAYLNGILKFVQKIKDDSADYLDYWNLLEKLALVAFVKSIEELEKDIKKTIETPIEQRGDNVHYLSLPRGGFSPFKIGDNRHIAAKIMDDRGIEALKILEVQ